MIPRRVDHGPGTLWGSLPCAFLGFHGGQRTRFISGEPMRRFKTPMQLTNGLFASNLVCSPEGNGSTLRRRVPTQDPCSGQAEPVRGASQGMYGLWGKPIPPDGKQLIFNADVNAPASPQTAVSKLAVVALDACSPSRSPVASPDPRMARGGRHRIYQPDGLHSRWKICGLHRSRSGRG